MPCRPFSHNGMTGFVCGPAPRRKKCSCGSGRDAVFLCDWKTPGETKTGTCDAAICSACSTRPAPEKDLCQRHAQAWVQWKTQQRENGK